MKNTTTIYSKSKLAVYAAIPGTFSHILNCQCKTIGHNNERAYLLKKVNFYNFRKYMTEVVKVANFPMWYNDTAVIDRLQAIADYINYSEKRTAYYMPETAEAKALNMLISRVENTNTFIRSFLNTH